MLGGISTRWKQIAAFYYTGDSTNGMILGDIPLQNFQKTSAIGLTNHSVTSDMGAANQAMWIKFGIMAGKHCATKHFLL
jgi:hypothetical protein